MTEFKEGDVFRWRWSDREMDTDRRKEEMRAGVLYWCCSRICIADSCGKLWDTFWSIRRNCDNRLVDPNKCELVFLGNLNDFDEAREPELNYYSDSDIMNISHSNMSRGGFYVRKGAKRDAGKVREIICRRIDSRKAEIEQIKRDISWLEQQALKENVDDVYL